jgi:tetrahydromethanopterin S-methyltransferase subunit G
MTTSPKTTISYTLEDILDRLEQKIDRQFSEVNQKIDKQFTEVNKQFIEVNQKIDKQSAEINQKLGKLEIGLVELSGEIKILDEKFNGVGKRIDNQEFLNRGILGALIVALVAGAAKLFGWLPTP